MGGVIFSENKTHAANIVLAEQVRQASVTPASTQQASNAAEIAYFRSVLRSAIANGCETSSASSALKALGVTGL